MHEQWTSVQNKMKKNKKKKDIIKQYNVKILI